MAGIEKITDQIIEEAKLSAASKVENARKEAEEILENARQECLKMEAEASEKEENLKKTHESRVKSSADQQRKRALLQAKQEIIKEVIDEAYRELKSQDSNSYFQTIEKLVKTYALPESGEIYFSKKGQADLLLQKTFQNLLSIEQIVLHHTCEFPSCIL